MYTEIHTSRVALSDWMRDLIHRRIDFALGRFDHVIEQVTISLSDINGPRGGVDQSCRIRVTLSGIRAPVITETVHEDLRSAVDASAERACRAVARLLDRQTKRRQKSVSLSMT